MTPIQIVAVGSLSVLAGIAAYAIVRWIDYRKKWRASIEEIRRGLFPEVKVPPDYEFLYAKAKVWRHRATKVWDKETIDLMAAIDSLVNQETN